MYITQNDIINLRLEDGKLKNTGQALNDLITKDMVEKSEMRSGRDYYNSEHDILKKKFNVYEVNGQEYTDESASNNRDMHTYHKLLVDQKSGYMVGNPITITTEPETSKESLNKAFGEVFNDKVSDWVVGASNKGVEYMHPFIDSKGDFKYIIISAIEIIPIYDTAYESTLMEVIRYYNFDYVEDGETKQRKNVEWWTSEDVTFYVEIDNGVFKLDPDEEINPRPHWADINTANNESEGNSWGRVPFIPLLNNTNAKTDLIPIKSLIDDFDFNVSDASNNLADLQEAIWVLMGYDGEDLGQFRKNLKTYKTIKVSEDGKAEPLTLDIPKEARDSHLDRLEQSIYTFGMGVNMNSDMFKGSMFATSIEGLYGLLDLKCKQLERKLQPALQDLSWFGLTFQGVDPSKVEITFTLNYATVINEEQIVNNLAISELPPKDYYKKHPYTLDVDTAVEWKEEQDGEIDLGVEDE